MVKDLVQLHTPVFHTDSHQSYIMLGNLEVLTVSGIVHRNDSKDDNGKPRKNGVINMILASLNQNPYLRQAIVSMVFGEAERLLIDPGRGDLALDTPALPSLSDHVEAPQ